MPVKHKKVMVLPDDGTSEVQPSNWNDVHDVDNITGIQDGQTPLTLTKWFLNFVALSNNWVEATFQNKSNGASASTDVVCTKDTGTATAGFIDMGINGSGYSVGTWTINGAGDGYLYVDGGHLAIGTATSGKELIFFVGGTLAANEAGRFQADGLLMPAPATDPAATASGKGKLYFKTIAGRVTPKWIGPSGMDVPIQAATWAQKTAIWNPPGNGTGVPGVFGMAALTAAGTATTRTVATTRFFTRVRRLGYVSAGTAGSMAGARYNSAQWTLGVPGTPALGGFFMACRFGCSDAATVAGARQFVGVMSATGALTNVEPSTLTNCIGVGHGAADTNLKIYYGGSAAQTPIDLGANFPANTLSVDMYELILHAPSNSNNTVYYRVTRLNTGDVAEGTLTGTAGTALPANTTLLTLFQANRTNNATALAVGLDIAHLYIEADY